MPAAVAIDKPCGSFAVDANGAAGYEYPLTLPPGSSEASTPQLSLRYAQSASNTIVGLGWDLQGLSSIELAPRTRAVDGEDAPPTYELDGRRLAVDGAELILTAGTYGEENAQYTTEVDQQQSITATGIGLEQSYRIVDASGRVREFGSTPDARELSADGRHVRAWRLSSSSDPSGNCATVSYTAAPRLHRGGDAEPANGVVYPDRIAYASNDRHGVPASYAVEFLYEDRADVVVATGAGDVFDMAYRLKRVEVTALVPPVLVRAYNLVYAYSEISRASLLTHIEEEGTDGSVLTPTVLTYASKGPEPSQWFQPAAATELYGPPSTQVIDLMPCSISGKALADLALLSYDGENMMLTSYIASVAQIQGDQPVLEWSRPQDPITYLPRAAPNAVQFLRADMDGNGRTDLVMAYDAVGLKLATVRSTGHGFAPYTVFDTGSAWNAGDSFLALDTTASGRIDVVQLTAVAGRVLLRVFFASDTGLGQVGEFPMSESAENTLSWFPADVNRDGRTDLVRVWYQESSDGATVLATAYVARSDGNLARFQAASTVPLGTYSHKELRRLLVMPCDINADGIQDIVTCLTNEIVGSETMLTFDMRVFLCNGAGSFIAQPRSPVQQVAVNNISHGSLEVMRLDGSSIPSLVYRYRDVYGAQYALISQSNYSGILDKFVPAPLLPPKPDALISLADINGTMKQGWFAWTPLQTAVSLQPIYNTHPLGDILTSVTDPLGLCTTPEYRPLTDPAVYEPPSADVKLSQGQTPVLGSARYVVARYTETNNATINALSVSETTEMYYAAACMDRVRGWQGFARVVTVKNWTTVDHYGQSWPLTGVKLRSDIYATASRDPIRQHLLSSQVSEFDTPSTHHVGGTSYRILSTLEQSNMYDKSQLMVGSGRTRTYDVEGFVDREVTFVLKDGNQSFQKGTRTVRTTRGNVRGLPSLQKATTISDNLNYFEFRDGDISLVNYDYDSRGLTTRRDDWSAYNGRAALFTFAYDEFGRQIESHSPSGLVKRIEYDPTFHFPVHTIESAPDLAIDLERYFAYDARFGVQVVETEYNGFTTVRELDAFGREIALKTSSESGTIIPYLVADERLTIGELTTVQTTSYEAVGTDGQQYLQKSVAALMSEQSKSIATSYVDSRGRMQHSVAQEGSFPARWTYRKLSQQGEILSESVPLLAPSHELLNCLTYIPDPKDCMVHEYDALQRLVRQVQPQARSAVNQLVRENEYLDGGLNVIITHRAPEVLSVTSVQLEMIGGEACLVSSTDGNGTTRFEYDAAAKRQRAVDSAGNVDRTQTDLQGLLLVTDNKYQNPYGKVVGAVRYGYDIAHRCIWQTNAMDETTRTTFDAKGRPLVRAGYDGRQVLYTYDGSPNGRGQLTSVEVSKDGTLESRYNFEYSTRGLPSSSTLTVPINGQERHFTIDYLYDLQGQVTSKHFPNGTTVELDHQGLHVQSSQMKGSDWMLNATFEYDAFQCSNWSLISTGTIGSNSFVSTNERDRIGAPISRTFRNESLQLVNESYEVDALSRISRFAEGNETVQYEYDAKRLRASRSIEQREYSYDAAGNLTRKDGMDLNHQTGRVQGTRNGEEIFSVEYDACGRMISRRYGSRTHFFAYDSSNQASGSSDDTGSVTRLAYDFLGRKLLEHRLDGTTIYLSPDYRVHVDSQRERVEHRFLGPDTLLATVTHRLKTYFTNSKGNITHVFDADGVQRIRYDDFGMLISGASNLSATYETRSMALDTGLLDFGARSYDPVLARFTTPDDKLGSSPLDACDAFNRYAFENNDPVNNTDPTGHWTMSSLWGLAIGVGLTVLGAMITVTTGGVGGAPGLALSALGWGLIGAGLAATPYTIANQNASGSEFWNGWGINVAAGFVTGALTAGLGRAFSAARFSGWAASGQIPKLGALTPAKARVFGWFANAAVHTLGGSTASVVDQVAYNLTLGKAWNEDLGLAFGTGAAFSFAGSVLEGTAPLLWKRLRRTNPRSFEQQLTKPVGAAEELFPADQWKLGTIWDAYGFNMESLGMISAISDATNMVAAIQKQIDGTKGRKQG